MALQDPRTGRQYTFELKDRIIRDEELDGWKEIPCKTDVNGTAEDQDYSIAEVKPLPGKPLQVESVPCKFEIVLAFCSSNDQEIDLQE